MRNLICINTYKSAGLIKAFVWDYIEFVRNNKNYDFIVSLDGLDTETIEYCKKYKIPLLYSEENEGVGISKNRIIESFSEYDNYFFIEDDIELLNPEVFDMHIKISEELNIHHFSLFEARRIRNQMHILESGKYHIIQAMYGGAPFNFFTKKGLETVGGFHTLFAKYKRFGHTEHTYRFVTNGLSKYPFQVIEECLEGYFRWNDPVSRIKINVKVSKNFLFVDEEKLIKEKLTYYPVETLSIYHQENIKNMNSNNILVDKYVWRHKKKFYAYLALLEHYRSMKKFMFSRKN
jgi:hypothetical protein